jgi:hypothetical protein
MKTFKSLVTESSKDTIVLAFGRMSPPTIGHGLLVQKVRDIAKEHGAPYAVYLSKTQDKKKNPLSVDRKVYWAKKMFPGAIIFPATDQIRTFIELVASFSGRYKNLIFVAGSDRVAEYQTLLDRYNGKDFKFDSITVASAGQRDPDADGAAGMSATKMRNAAATGDGRTFRLGTGLNQMDSDKMMHEVRAGMGIKPVTESNPTISKERNAFFLGETFREGEFVSCLTDTESKLYEILDRGTNYVTVADTRTGDISKKFINTLLVVENSMSESAYDANQICFKGYLTSYEFNMNEEVRTSFCETIRRLEEGDISDSIAIMKAIRAVDSALNGIDEQKSWETARASLSRANEMNNHTYLHPIQEETANIKVSDKLRVASVIADTLGSDSTGTNSAVIVNNALRKVRSNSAMRRGESLKIIARMLELADQVGIGYDKNILKDMAVAESFDEGVKRPTRPDRFHITKTDGKPATLASYPDKESATKDRDAKYPDALVQRITAQGKLVEESELDEASDYFKRRREEEDIISGKKPARKKMPTGSDYSKRRTKEKVNEELDEAHKIGTPVEITHGSAKGTKGTIGEIRHGLHKDAPKKYTVYHGEHGAVQLSKEHFKAIKESAEEDLNELSTKKLGDYKKKAGEEASAADKSGDTKKADKRFSGIMKATRKQFDNDIKESYSVGKSVRVKHESGREMSGKVKGVHGSVVEISHRNGKVGFYHSHKLELLNELDPVEVKESLTYADLVRARKLANHPEGYEPPEDVLAAKTEVPKREGHSMNPSNETHRKQLLNHLKGN